MKLAFTYIFVLIALTTACHEKGSNKTQFFENDCGCELSQYNMSKMLPLKAVGDSVVVCKLGNNRVIGNGAPDTPMNYLDYLRSDFFGGEGKLFNCNTNELFSINSYEPQLSYKNASLIIDHRMRFFVYDELLHKWLDLRWPAYRQLLSAKDDKFIISDNTIIFKPAKHGPKAFKTTDTLYHRIKTKYNASGQRKLMHQLFACAVNGDKLSEKRFLNFYTSEFVPNASGPATETYEKYLELYRSYTNALKNGLEKEYFDLTIFPYFDEVNYPNLRR